MSVVNLLPNKALAADKAQIATRVREFADRIEAGDFGEPDRVLVVVEGASGIDHRMYGRPTTNMELVGLMEYSKLAVMSMGSES